VGELSHAKDYPYHILNDDLEKAARDLTAIVDTCFRKGS
jgi:guanylate kinase